MKLIRYIFIAGLLYFVVSLTYYAISPPLGVAMASEATETEPAVTLPSNYPEMVADYRLAVLPWIALPALILSGWLFWRKPKFVFCVSLLSFAVLGGLVFWRIRVLGHTMTQSFSALSQGYRYAFFYQSLFCLLAIFALLLIIFIKNAKPPLTS